MSKGKFKKFDVDIATDEEEGYHKIEELQFPEEKEEQEIFYKEHCKGDKNSMVSLGLFSDIIENGDLDESLKNILVVKYNNVSHCFSGQDIRYFLEAGKDGNNKKLTEKAKKIIKRFLINDESELFESDDNLNEIRELLTTNFMINKEYEDNKTPLHIAASNGCIELTKLLIEKGAAINVKDKNGNTPLIYATFETGKILLKNGADVNIQNNSGHSALYVAADTKNQPPDFIKLLLDYGADINIQDKMGKTPLMDACSEGPIENVKVLLERGADPNIRSIYGYTALMNASSGLVDESFDMVKLLIEHGADPNLKNREGDDAYTISQDEKIKRYLKKIIQKNRENRFKNIDLMINVIETAYAMNKPPVDPQTNLKLSDDEIKYIISAKKNVDKNYVLRKPRKIDMLGMKLSLVEYEAESKDSGEILYFTQIQIRDKNNRNLLDLGWFPSDIEVENTGSFDYTSKSFEVLLQKLWNEQRFLSDVGYSNLSRKILKPECCRINLRKPVEYWLDDKIRKFKNMVDEVANLL
jgi:ankyrin repeat protein